MLPLALTWLVGTVVAIGIAGHFAQQAFDRSLLDDAQVVASNVRAVRDGALELEFTPRELKTVLFDQEEQLLLAVLTPSGARIAGDPRLQPQKPQDGSDWRFVDVTLDGLRMRAVTLVKQQPSPFYVVMAQTTRSRVVLLRRMLLYSLAPQALLLLLLAWGVRRAIARDLEPLAGLQRAVGSRDAQDLSPVPLQATTSDIEQLAVAVNSLLGRLQHSVRAQREFAGNVAHELRTPLAGIRALAAYGLTQKDPAAWRSQLERIAQSEARASRLVDQLLALALADEGRAGLSLETLSLDDLVSEAILRYLPRADAVGLDLGARGIGDGVTVAADRTLIEGVLNNLLDNALRYARGDGVSVTVSIAREGGEVALSVIDTGPGLEPGLHEKLTGRWAQGQSGALLGEGSGLGLAIVSQYAQLMNGRFRLEPGPGGKGLAASIVLPLAGV